VPQHGLFEGRDVDLTPNFRAHLEEVSGRDIRAHNDEKLHNHGSSTVKYAAAPFSPSTSPTAAT